MLSKQEVIEDLSRKKIRNFNTEGFDDCRIFEFRGQSWFTCNTLDTSEFGSIQISLCKLGENANSSSVKVESLLPLKGPDPRRCEKNWLPFIKDDAVHLIYSYDPFIIYKPDMQSGECETVVRYAPALDFSHLRGSAGPIPFDSGYLVLVHEVVFLPEYERCYLHRFIYLDEKFQVTKASKPFVFFHLGVEYCCSMTLGHKQNELVLAVGSEDREAYLCAANVDTIRALLDPLPTPTQPFFQE